MSTRTEEEERGGERKRERSGEAGKKLRAVYSDSEIISNFDRLS